MTSTRVTAVGRAAHAVMRYLHRWPVQAIHLFRPLDLGGGPEPKKRAEIEDHIRVALAAPAAEMHYASLPTTHLSDAREEVLHAIGLAERLGGRHPIDVLEEQLDHTLATLRSPRVWHAIKHLSWAALGCPGGKMESARVERVIREGLNDLAGADFSAAPHPRTIRVLPGAPPGGQCRSPNLCLRQRRGRLRRQSVRSIADRCERRAHSGLR